MTYLKGLSTTWLFPSSPFFLPLVNKRDGGWIQVFTVPGDLYWASWRPHWYTKITPKFINRASVLFLHYHQLSSLSWLMITHNKLKKLKIPFSNNLTAAQNRIHQFGSCSTGDEVARKLHDPRSCLKFTYLHRKWSANPLPWIHIDGWSANAFKTHHSPQHLVSWVTILKPHGLTQLCSRTFSNRHKMFERKQTSRWPNETDGLLKFLFIWSLLRT